MLKLNNSLFGSDKEVSSLLGMEKERQNTQISLIPSENYVSNAVLEASGSIATNKYSEGYPGKRYYGGNKFIDQIEKLAVDRAKKLFGVPHANVQPYSGSPANLAVYLALCKPGDVIMGQNLPDGGHLTHGWKDSFTGQLFKSFPYHVKEDGYIDLEEVKFLAINNKPKLIWVGATAYVREFPFEELGKIADDVGAYLVADIAHIAGLVVAGVHKNPAPFVDIITTTTHKTLRGPRGGIIMVTEKGLKKDPELSKKIDRAIFPGLQGGPHDNTTAAIAVALYEAENPEFIEYAKQVVKNSKTLANNLKENGLKLVSGGTDNHIVLVDLTPNGNGLGIFAQDALEECGIICNKNTVPKDPASPFYPSGIRLGTPAVTTRGMKESEMKLIAEWVAEIVNIVSGYKLPAEKTKRIEHLKKFREEIKLDKSVVKIKKQVCELCKKFPVYN